MNIASTKLDVLDSLKNAEYRSAFTQEHVYTTICFQIRALREQRHLSQKSLGLEVSPPMAQERISILEDVNSETKPALNTLLRLADAFDVGLDVRFIPFGKLLYHSVDTDMRQLEVPSFHEELPVLEGEIRSEIALETGSALSERVTEPSNPIVPPAQVGTANSSPDNVATNILVAAGNTDSRNKSATRALNQPYAYAA